MKIENNIILSNVFNIALILLVGFFAMQNLNVMLTKLRFVEIADDLNASFLEMRISEKNYFLYGDEAALFEIRDKINNTMESIEGVRNDIARAIGEDNLEKLRDYLKRYSTAVEEMRRSGSRDIQMETMLRAAGRKLREFSETTTRLEKRRVNEIIANSKKVLFYSFWAIVVMAVVVSHFISQKILRSLREIEKLAESISKGNFSGVSGVIPADEFGAVMSAINTMSEELKTREEELIQSKKLASLGVLTAGVAHELTNPLNNISMIAQNFVEYHDFLNRENRIELMRKVEGEAERIQEIVRNLLDFSKPKEANLKEADINDTLQKALKLMQNTLDISNIETRLSLRSDLPHVFIDGHQIEQVFVNLILNAVHAMSPSGTLYLATGFSENGDTVRIEVRDTGKGIQPEFLPHIFDPFFTTKGVGGTGLGLSVSYGIIKNHKGNVRVESTVGAGTTFTIELPVYKGKEAGDEQIQDNGDR
ncbi:MAG: ATP-binding protein [Candidatus Sulfobium sp.]|jgi:two-component system, NtrC family, sensor kinase